jgi:hypothetical protein
MNKKELDEIKKEIEDRNLWHLVSCIHCYTVFLVEDSIGNNLIDREKMFFRCYCPRCGTLNQQATLKRLKLKLDRPARQNEFAPVVKRLAKNLKFPPKPKAE